MCVGIGVDVWVGRWAGGCRCRRPRPRPRRRQCRSRCRCRSQVSASASVDLGLSVPVVQCLFERVLVCASLGHSQCRLWWTAYHPAHEHVWVWMLVSAPSFVSMHAPALVHGGACWGVRL